MVNESRREKMEFCYFSYFLCKIFTFDPQLFAGKLSLRASGSSPSIVGGGGAQVCFRATPIKPFGKLVSVPHPLFNCFFLENFSKIIVKFKVKLIQNEHRNRQINHARNIWDRAVTILPRATQFWLKYSYMEELVENIPGARQV